MKKRFLAMLLICSFLLCLVGCGRGDRYQKAADLAAEGDYSAAAEIFEELGDYQDSAEQLALCRHELNYAQACQRLEEGAFSEAQDLFRALGDFRDSAEMVLECRYREADALAGGSRYDEAVQLYEELAGYKDSADLALDVRYRQALALLDSARYDRACAVLRALGDYRDSAERLALAEELAEAQFQLSQAAPGDIVYFGRAEQDGNSENGAEDLAWVLLAKEDGRALLLCRDGLDCRCFHDDFVSCHWDSSSLRTWLNGEFLENAFTPAERQSIVNTLVPAEGNAAYGVDGGGDSVCAVFLLSADEAGSYLAQFPEQAVTMPTETAAAAGVRTQPNGCCSWWLRSPGINDKYLAYVDTEGTVSYEGMFCDNRHFAVRPALWLALSEEGMPDTAAELSAPATLPENREPESYELAATVDMGQEYFNNILFVGDSTSFGMTEGGVPRDQVWTGTGHTFSLYEQSYANVVYQHSPRKLATIKQAAADMQPDLLIITLGMRQLAMMKEDLFKSEYTDLVTGIQEVSPHTKIVLNSIFPLAAHMDKSEINFTNDMIITTNGWLREVAQATGVRYLDSYSLLLDEDGYLVARYAKPDGLHFNSTYGVPAQIEVFRTHAYY